MKTLTGALMMGAAITAPEYLSLNSLSLIGYFLMGVGAFFVGLAED